MLTFFRIACIAATFLALHIPSAEAQNYDARRTISVTGSAEVRAAPTEVELSMSVETNSMSLDKARADNDSKVSAILVMAKNFGIEGRDIQTDFLQVEPRYDDRTNAAGVDIGRKFLGYFMTKHIAITLHDISKFETFIAQAMKLGTNYINGTEFKTSDIRKYRDEARIKAIRAAKEKATALSGELEQKIGKPITIRDEPPIVPNINSNFNGRSEVFDARWELPDSKTSIAVGELRINALVSVTFELE